MKKVLFLIVTLVCAVTGAWAGNLTVSYDSGTGTLTITSDEAGKLTTSMVSDYTAATTIVLAGKFSSADLTAINANQGFTSVKTVNMKNAEFPKQSNNNTQYYMYNTEPQSGNQGSLYVIGGDLYKGAAGAHAIDVVDSGASNSFQDAQGDWWDYQYEEKLAYNNGYYRFRKDKYYHKENGEWVSVEKADIPDNTNIEYRNNDTDQNLSNFNTSNEYICVHSSSEYSYYHAYTSYTWQKQDSYSDTHQVGEYYASINDARPATANDQYSQGVAVGGTLKIYKNGSFDVFEEDPNDWEQIVFNGWHGLETIILPDGFNVESGKNYNNFYDNNKSTLKRIQRGDSYALITHSGDNHLAEIHCDADDVDNMKAIVKINSYVSDANITVVDTNDNDYIKWNNTTGVYDVHVTSENSLIAKFTTLYNSVGATNLNGTTFHFESACTGFTAADLQALALKSNNVHLYLDFYDVPTTPAIENAIKDAIKGNTANNIQPLESGYYYQGVLLPKNPQSIGTTLIAEAGANTPVKDFITYQNGTTTTAHILNPRGSTSGDEPYVAKLNALKGLFDDHSEIAQSTSVYLVSSNSDNPISTVTSIKGTSTASVVHTYNNEMVDPDATKPTKPKIEVTPAATGAYATLNEATNMRNTPNTDVLKFKGAINTADILAVNSFTQVTWSDAANGGNGGYVEAVWSNDANEGNGGWIPAGENDPRTYNGPRVLDLSEVPAATITQDLLNNLENPMIEYIILPAGMDAPVVGNYAKLTSLKSVISSNKSTDTKHVLNAYVREAGSLAEARVLATGNASGGTGLSPKVQGLTEVKLSGNLNTDDVSVSNGCGLSGELSTIATLDLSGASFNPASNMKLGSDGAGFSASTVLTEVKLPTAMTEIPASCLKGIASLHNLHIPYNYKKIGFEAFRETKIDHITTEDAAGVMIDNGPNTYTFSANIEEIGEAGHTEGTHTFPQTVRITDVYCLGAKAPKCYRATFPAQILTGNGGANEGIYCIDKYQSLKENEKCFALLHFPSLESYTNATGEKDASYDKMVAHYTDPSRAYTKKDQTGAVDANGDPLTWPDQGELYLTYGIAATGNIWNDYPNMSYEGSDHHLTNFGTATSGPHDVTNVDDPYSFRPDYTGWHEFVLSMATFVEQKNTEGNCYYEDAGMFTFCIPFDLTYSQVVRMLGIPASTEKVKNYLGATKVTGEDNTVTYEGGEKQDDDVMPEIRQLASVLRTKGTNGGSNTVNFRLTRNLVNPTNKKNVGYLEFSEDGSKETKSAGDLTGSNPNDPICLVGGRPYIIKAYMRVGEKDKLTARNLGEYIMTRYADEFGLSASCVNSEEYSEQLETFTGEANAATVKLKNNEPEKLVTMKFAKPYENHKVLAVDGAENGGALNYVKDDETETGYYYTFVGQFWEQDLPLYCVYLGQNGSWYRYSKENANYKWNAYKCVIMATPEVTATSDIKEENAIETAMGIKPDVTANPQPYTALATGYNFNHFGGGFRNISHCYFPMNYVGTTDLIPAPMSLWFIGRDDYTFKNQTAASSATSRYIFSIDDDEEIVDLGENVTEVKAIDMLDGVLQIYGDMKVYNLSGQYVGNSTEGLSKGIYIVGGRKVVVE